MAKYTPDQYQLRLRRLARDIKRGGSRTAEASAKYMESTAKGVAPRKKGDLREGIVARPKGKGARWEVTSSVKGPFPYQFWVNNQAPYRTLGMVWNQRRGTVYGDGSHTVTGTPGYWSYAFRRTALFAKRVGRKNMQKALRVRIG